jgi:hypothetical protein
MFSMAMWMAVMLALIQLLGGDQRELNTLEYQPAKIRAMERDWDTRPGTPLTLFAMFPLAYAVILPARYPAIVLRRLALAFRGASVESRFHAVTNHGRMWWTGRCGFRDRRVPPEASSRRPASCRESA